MRYRCNFIKRIKNGEISNSKSQNHQNSSAIRSYLKDATNIVEDTEDEMTEWRTTGEVQDQDARDKTTKKKQTKA